MPDPNETQKLSAEDLEKVIRRRCRHWVAVDIDGVIAQYNKWGGLDLIGDPIKGAKSFLSVLSDRWNVWIHSTRLSPRYHPDVAPLRLKEIISDYLAVNDLPYDDVWCSRGKPMAIAYVDDRGVSCRPQDHENPEVAFATALQQIEFLEDVKKLQKVTPPKPAEDIE
jgi:hypothetical protein